MKQDLVGKTPVKRVILESKWEMCKMFTQYAITGPCKVRNGTETKHSETKRNTTKRNEIQRNETKQNM